MNTPSEGPIFIVLAALGVVMTLIVAGGMIAFFRLARRHERDLARRRATRANPGESPAPPR